MKRLFILAAATVALASCTKTQVVYNEEPQEIAFRQVENVMTKTNTSLGYWADGSMGVFAYKTSDGTEYFANAKFAKADDKNYWVGSGKNYYWPFQGALDFYFYAPHQGTGASVSVADKELTISFTNEDYEYDNNTPYVGSGTDLNYNCADLMYGSEIITESKDGAADDAGISVTLKHALALVQVNAKAIPTGVVSIKSMTLEDTPANADLTVDYNTGSPSWAYDSPLQELDLTIFKTTTNIDPATITDSFTQLGNEVLVIPGKAQTSFRITYTLGDLDAVFTATLPLSNGTTPTWEPGKKYVYNISFGLEEIKFAPEVTPWDANTDGNALNGDDETDIEI